jgi:hypothetical protein
MAQEEKELLIRDICGRLPYGVKVQIDFGEYCIKYGIDRYIDDTVICVYPETFEIGVNNEDQACDIEDVKPYLRPMSSMTEEEKNIYEYNRNSNVEVVRTALFDWLNKKMFDYRGLIEKGLAIEAPEGMYNTKTE